MVFHFSVVFVYVTNTGGGMGIEKFDDGFRIFIDCVISNKVSASKQW